ncbi:MAG: TolC family protein [Fibrobacter sp.]|nr:TolC family protein [Fibrobacter sp.]
MNFKINVIVLFILSIVLCKNSFSLSCSERDFIIIALQNNHTIKLTNTIRAYDSLSLQLIKCGWLPEIKLTADPSVLNTNNDKIISLSMSAGIEQKIPGGAEIHAGITHTDSKLVKDNSSFQSDDITIGITQPFLKNAGKYNDIHYTIQLGLLDNKNLTLDKIKTINETLSQIRHQYWDYCSQQLLDSTYKQVMHRNEEMLNSSRAQFFVGEIAELDTLSSSLSYYQSLQQCFESELLLKQAKNKLARSINVSHDTMIVIIQRPDSIADLPDVSTLLNVIQRFDPSIKQFVNLQEKFRVMHKKQKNSLFPSLDGYITHTFSRVDQSMFSENKSNNNTVLGLLLSYSIPVTKQKIALEQVSLQQRISNSNYDNYTDELKVKINELHDSWIQEKKRIELAKKSNAIALLQYDAAIKAFSIGTIDRQSLLKMQNDLLESNVAYIRLMITMKKIEIIFDELTGTVFDRFGITY